MANQKPILVREFNSVIKEYIDFLSGSDAPGAAHWSKMLAEATNEPDSVSIAKRVLSFYGGMGSINDIGFRSGSDAAKRYEQLNEELYSLAKKIIQVNTARRRASKHSSKH